MSLNTHKEILLMDTLIIRSLLQPTVNIAKASSKTKKQVMEGNVPSLVN